MLIVLQKKQKKTINKKCQNLTYKVLSFRRDFRRDGSRVEILLFDNFLKWNETVPNTS